MRPRHKLRRAQQGAAEFIFHNPSAMLHMYMGLGKTGACLTAIVDLINYAQIWGVLVVAPRLVAETVWDHEVREWSHTAHLKVCVLRGRSKETMQRDLIRDFDIWVINYESLPWLATELNRMFLAYGRMPPFNMLIWDEVTRVKNPDGQRISMMYARPEGGGRSLIEYFDRRIGLTGTPSPNGYIDLFGQYLAVAPDIFGTYKPAFEEKYFITIPNIGKKVLAKGAKDMIHRDMAPVTFSVDLEDCPDLPPIIVNDIWVDLPAKLQAEYERFERTMFAELEHGAIEVDHPSSVLMKCRQLASGIFMETGADMYHEVHKVKMERLDNIVEEAGGRPVLVSYVFVPDAERIQAAYLKKKKIVRLLNSRVGKDEARNLINDWNAGKIDMLLMHHKSGGHGLNIQFGGHEVVWFGVDWPLEGYLQLNARLARPGQRNQHVIVHRILTRGTVDEAMRERLEDKDEEQEDMMAAMRALCNYRDRKMGVSDAA